MYKLYCRAFQQSFKFGFKFMNWRIPELLEGENSLLNLPATIQAKGVGRVLVVTDQGIAKLGIMDPLLDALQQQGIYYAVYDNTVPNPTIENIEEALQQYHAHHCQGIIAFGGGSPMDCAKGVAARVVRPEKTIPQMKGLFKVGRPIPPFFAIPTTAGTGSEGTVAAVVSNSETKEKYPVNDPQLIPHVAVLDPLLTVGLPKHITSTTGMDALTHAIEAYIGNSNTKETREYSREAVQLIYDNLLKAYHNGDDIEARKNMQRASFLAGLAFTRAYVGNVHAIAHTLGGFYHVPHGLANAVILPHVLKFYGETVYEPLAELADLIGFATGKSKREQTERFIQWIEDMNAEMQIPKKIKGIVNRDIPTMVERALSEANPLYPVPKIMNADEMFYMYQTIQA